MSPAVETGLAPKNQPGGAATRTTRPLRVVVLDDCRTLTGAFSTALKNWYDGIVAVECHTGDEAWEELSRTDPDVLMTDVQQMGLPVTDMLQLLAAKGVTYPIFVITGSSGLEQHLLKAGGPNLKVSVKAKPLTLDEFQQVAETALGVPARPQR